jgi:hypothetical protein
MSGAMMLRARAGIAMNTGTQVKTNEQTSLLRHGLGEE